MCAVNDEVEDCPTLLPCWALLPSAAWYHVALWLDLPSLRSFMLSCKPCSEALRPAPEFRAAWLDNLAHVFPRDPVLQEREMSHPDTNTHIRFLALTPDGTKAVVSHLDKLLVWDLCTDTCAATLLGHAGEVSALAASPTEPLAVSGDETGQVLVWDLGTMSRRAQLAGHTRAVNAVTVTPCGKKAVSASNDKTLRVWDLEGGTCTAVLEGHTGNIVNMQLTGDGQCAVSLSCDHTLRVWDLGSGHCRSVLPDVFDQNSSIVALRVHGNIATSIVWTSLRSVVTVWDLETGVALRELTQDCEWTCAVLLPGGWELVLGCDDGCLFVWDVQTGECRAVLEGHRYFVRCLAAPPSAGPRSRACFVSGSVDHNLCVWGVSEDGRWQRRAVLTGDACTTCLAMSPGGRYVVAGDERRRLRVWDLGARGV
mmetsp:Transcript_3553/g.7732  ORF Transcript_3553/g.7732 Transcript_3553/m.7732 type:complete len:425 (+) Transcript_3553:170-1444(+)